MKSLYDFTLEIFVYYVRLFSVGKYVEPVNPCNIFIYNIAFLHTDRIYCTNNEIKNVTCCYSYHVYVLCLSVIEIRNPNISDKSLLSLLFNTVRLKM